MGLPGLATAPDISIWIAKLNQAASQIDALLGDCEDEFLSTGTRLTEIHQRSSTIVDTARPDLLLFILHPFLSPDRWKPTSAALLARADVVIVNRPAAAETREPSSAVLDAVAAQRTGDVRVADVTSPLADWAPDLLARFHPSLQVPTTA